MWISTVHIIVIVYYIACATTSETRTWRYEHEKKLINKRSLDAYNNYKHNSYNSNSLKLRHKSRFPNLDKVKMRITNMHFGGSDEELNENSDVKNRLRHNSWYEKKKTTTTTTTTTMRTDEVFENYFDYDYGNDKEDDNWEYEGDNEYEDYEEDGVFSETSGWQAEEPTEKPTTTPPRTMSRISEMKWQMYGTREKVEENRKKELFTNNAGSETSATLARVHFMRVNSEGTCKKPLPRVISVQSEHPDPTKSYTPHCTLLYRCAEDTGCCQTHNMRCGPKKQEEVQLYFYTKALGTLQSKIEKLTFFNHTECTCVEKSKSENSGNSKTLFGIETRSTTPQNLEICTCPGSFRPIQKYESQCTCNCEETNEDCLRMKNGLEYFSLAERKCIIERKCGIPICEFGAFLRPKGRCPRKQEKLDAFGHLNID